MATTSATLVLLPTTTAVVPSRGGEHSADGNPHPSSTTRAAGRARRPPRPHRTRTARRFRMEEHVRTPAAADIASTAGAAPAREHRRRESRWSISTPVADRPDGPVWWA